MSLPTATPRDCADSTNRLPAFDTAKSVWPRATAVAGSSQLPECPFEGLDLAFVIDLLALGQFQGFQHEFHFVERVFQFFDHLVHLFDGPADGWNFGARFGFPWRRVFRFFGGGGLRSFGQIG